MSRRALIVGINEYHNVKNLKGAVNDAKKIEEVLERHDHTDERDKNFDITLLTSDTHKITTEFLKDQIEELFRDPREISLLYFSGHGYMENTGGYLFTTENSRGDQGVAMNDILFMANKSPATNRIIILDCCHSGGFGKDPLNKDIVSITEGVTILSASAPDQYALELNGEGVFTKLLIHALEGGGANILGEISAGSVYSYIDKSMGENGQRPFFTTNVRRFVTLRRIKSQIKKNELRALTTLFPNGPNEVLEMDPSFEPESKNPNVDNIKKFALLQKYNRVNLVVPVDAPHMYHAAMWSTSCKLTPLGKSYWVMVKNNII
jgi:hypothetical protein